MSLRSSSLPTSLPIIVGRSASTVVVVDRPAPAPADGAARSPAALPAPDRTSGARRGPPDVEPSSSGRRRLPMAPIVTAAGRCAGRRPRRTPSMVRQMSVCWPPPRRECRFRSDPCWRVSLLGRAAHAALSATGTVRAVRWVPVARDVRIRRSAAPGRRIAPGERFDWYASRPDCAARATAHGG